MNPNEPFPQKEVYVRATVRWYVCHGCGWEAWISDGVRNSAGCGNPECYTPDVHIHSNADGEQPKKLLV